MLTGYIVIHAENSVKMCAGFPIYNPFEYQQVVLNTIDKNQEKGRCVLQCCTATLYSSVVFWESTYKQQQIKNDECITRKGNTLVLPDVC